MSLDAGAAKDVRKKTGNVKDTLICWLFKTPRLAQLSSSLFLKSTFLFQDKTLSSGLSSCLILELQVSREAGLLFLMWRQTD